MHYYHTIMVMLIDKMLIGNHLYVMSMLQLFHYIQMHNDANY
jgi:hypothetical protein